MSSNMTRLDVAELFLNFVGGEPPCNYNGIDELTIDCEWCEDNCGVAKPIDCWLYAIKNNWVGKEK